MAYTFVLVHGAFHGGWCWQRVADRLRAGGHKVFTPTLTGLGERSHLLCPDNHIDLETHITDIVNVLRWERLSDVVLCGHSYGGFIVCGVAERMASALRALVFVDAFLPQNGDMPLSGTSAAVQDSIRAASARGDLGLPPRSAESFGVNEADRAWVDGLCVPHPIGTLTQNIVLTGACEKITRKMYIRAQNHANPGSVRSAAAVQSDPSWRYHEVPCGHDIMVDAPEALAALLMAAAA